MPHRVATFQDRRRDTVHRGQGSSFSCVRGDDKHPVLMDWRDAGGFSTLRHTQ